MAKTKAARRICQYNRAKSHGHGDENIIQHDVALAAFGALLWLGVPFVLALLKQFGVW